MKKLLLFVCLLGAILSTRAQEVRISGNKFTVGNSEIWFNGINSPWHKFVDFGRSDFDPAWWTNEFARYKTNKINLARVWIHCSGEISPDIDATGKVTGTNAKFWEHMDHLMDVSAINQVYLMPALLSFDITKNSYPTHQSWRAWLQSEANIQSYIDNVLIPMVQRYDNRPYLLAWEICNEPEWMFENTEHGPQSFADVQKMHAMFAAAVHENSSKYVTTGSAAPKWNSPIYDSWGDKEGNMFSDSALSATINNPKAYLDFYQYHWYPWQTQWMKSPFTMTTAQYGVDDRPVIVGESEGNDVCDQYLCQTVVEMYENAYLNGFDGVCAWKTPQNDGHGTFDNIAVATNAFYSKHPKLVYPDGSAPIIVTGVTVSPTALSFISIGATGTLTATVSPANATNKSVFWSSSNAAVAKVSGGVVTAVANGTATITATTLDQSKTATCLVTVADTAVGGDCASPTAITLPFTKDGVGEFCWATTEEPGYVNSWNLEKLTINGEDFTNKWSNTMPLAQDGKWVIHYIARYNWSHFEIPQTKSALGDRLSDQLGGVKVFPVPFRNEFFVELANPVEVQNIELLNITGQRIQMLKRAEIKRLNTIQVDQPGAIYILRINTTQGNIVKRIINK